MKRVLLYSILFMCIAGCKTAEDYYNTDEGETIVRNLENAFLMLENDITTDINADDSSRYRNFMKLPMVEALKQDKDFIHIYYNPLILNGTVTDFSFGFTNPELNYRDIVTHTRGRFKYKEYSGNTKNWGEYKILAKINHFLDSRDNKEKGLFEVRILVKNTIVIQYFRMY